MASFTLKNIPEELYERLKHTAEANHRSINSEIIACIELALFSQPLDPEAVIARARILRQRSAAYRITKVR